MPSSDLARTIDAAWEARDGISTATKGEYRDAVEAALEGMDSGEWILVDLGIAVVHIMQPAIRHYYNLEELWGGTAALPRRASGLRS